MHGLSEKEAHDALTRASLKDKGYEEVTIGLLHIILTEPKNAAKVSFIIDSWVQLTFMFIIKPRFL